MQGKGANSLREDSANPFNKMDLKIGHLAEDILLDKEEGDEIDQDEDADHHNSNRSDEDKYEECDKEEDSHHD